jgi:hypothetical protein
MAYDKRRTAKNTKAAKKTPERICALFVVE